MITRRIIPCLDVRDGKVVKGVQFKNHKIVGSIVDLAKKYSTEGADELVFYDISASTVGATVKKEWVSKISDVINIPFLNLLFSISSKKDTNATFASYSPTGP